MSDPATYMPLVYTPTVGEACQKFGHIFREPRGMYLPISARGRLKELLSNWPEKDVRFIVVTDGERILGLGDLGAGVMGIPIGKLSLYTACAGVPPQYCLPIVLDVGTNNQVLLDDPLYQGLRQQRLRGEEYLAFVNEFVAAVQQLYPSCCIQWEDFANFNAVPILARYRDNICTFNDDIQGTAGVALAGIYGALRLTGKKLAEQRFLFLGAGSAATGIAELISLAMAQEGADLAAARRRNALFDINGLLVTSRTDLADFQKPCAQEAPPVSTFVEAVEALRPTGIIGVSTVPKLFNREVIEAMAKINERPIIFPYSNPTSRSECTAEEAYRWSGGRAVFASGSPFPPVEINGRHFVPGQGNNVYIFPTMGRAVMPSVMVAPMTSNVVVARSASCTRPLAILNKKTPGSIDTTAAKPMAANGMWRRRATGVSISPTTRHATKAPVAAPEPSSAIAAQRSACASMPTATGHGSIVSGVEKKTLYAATATPAAITSCHSGTARPGASTGRETPSSARPSSNPVEVATMMSPA